jgi:hypothetical protein
MVVTDLVWGNFLLLQKDLDIQHLDKQVQVYLRNTGHEQ